MKRLLLVGLTICTLHGSQQSSQQLSPLFKAVQDNNLETLEKLVQESQATGTDILNNPALFTQEKLSPLAFALKVRAPLTTLQFLVAQGASLTFVQSNNSQEKKSQEGKNLLQLLFEKSHPPLPQGMLSEKRDRYISVVGHYLAHVGAPMYTQEKTGPAKSVLESLADRPALHQQFTRLAKIDGRRADGSTDLIHAVKKGDTATVCQLLKKGACPNVPDLTGTTPLHYACYSNNMPLITLLLDAGACIDNTQRNRSGLTQLDVAISTRNPDTVQMLVNHNPASVNPSGRPGPVIKSFTTTDGGPGVMGNCTTPLHLACSLADEKMVNILLAEHPSIDTQDKYGNTALHIAAHSGKTALVEQLLKASASVDIPNKRGRTALFCAAANGQPYVVTALLQAGANPRHKDNLTETPLSVASRNGYIKIAQALLAAAPEALTDKNDFKEETTLQEGLQSRYPDIVALFKMYQERSLQEALLKALENNDVRAVSQEVQKNGGEILNNPNYFNEHGLSPLAQAFARCAPSEVIHFLIKNGAKIACTRWPYFLQKPLEKQATVLTTRDQSLELVCVEAERVLLAQKKSQKQIDQYLTFIRKVHPEPHPVFTNALKDVTDDSEFFTRSSYEKRKKLDLTPQELNAPLKNGSTLLIEAATQGTLEEVEQLLQAGADPSLKNRPGNTALHQAVLRGDNQVAQTLLHANVPVNAQGGFGSTALHYAVQQDNLEMTTVLMEAGAWSTLKNTDGQSPLDIAFDSKNTKALELLLGKMSPSEKDWFNGGPLLLRTCSKEGYRDVAALFLKYGTPATTTDCEENTPLHQACKEGNLATIDLLLIYGASVDAQDDTRRTPLFLSCFNGYLEVVARLLKAEANAQIPDKNGNTPLQAAAANGHTDIVDTLLQTPGGRATFMSHNSDGNTALHLACHNGHLETAKRLCKGSGKEASEKESSMPLNGDETHTVIALKNRQGNTALTLACQEDKTEVVELLLKEWASRTTQPERNEQPQSRNVFVEKSTRKVLRINDAQALIASADLEGKNSLHHACQTRSNVEIVQLLLAYGALINQQDHEGKTALFLACESGNANAADLLLCNGADYRINDNNGNTLLHAAMGNRHPRLARMLINLNAQWMYQVNNILQREIPADLLGDYEGLDFYKALWTDYNMGLPKSVGLDALAKGYRLPEMWQEFCDHSC